MMPLKRTSMREAVKRFSVSSLLLCASLAPMLRAQVIAPKSKEEGKPATREQAKADEHKLPAERGEVVDRIVATVNGDLVLESDVEEEERFTKLYPYGTGQGEPLRQQAIKRLIDRTLIQQQLAGFPQTPVTKEQVSQDEADLRKDLPACAHADCTTDAGWKKFLADAGFTEDELRDRIRLRSQVLHFIEQRFRSAVRITDKQIEEFYNKNMLPEYAKQNATAPPLDSVRDRVSELLLQQQVSALLDDWLKSLRESGRVRIMKSGEEAP
ncbi:MAG: hypothetical protein ACRYGF_01715 [Janthinobacterium lividum]